MASFPKSTVLARVRTLLREPTARLYSDTELNAWIDEAARAVSVLTLCNETKDAAITLSEHIPYVDLTKDFIEITSVVLLPSGSNSSADIGLQRIVPGMVGHGEVGLSSDTTGIYPKFYFYIQDTTPALFVWPPPITDAAHKVDVYGFTMVDSYGGAGSETLPDELQHITIDYVMCMAKVKAKKHSTAASYMKRFIDNCASVRNDVYERLMLVDTKDMLHIPDRVVPISQ
jgi:hypothetical protein